MKNIKTILALFIVSTVLGIAGVNAAGEHLNLVGIHLSSFSGVYNIGTAYNKTVNSFQYIQTTGTVDNVTGGDRNISAQVTSGSNSSSWTITTRGTTGTWTESFTKNPGAFSLNLKATKSTLASVTYTGTWYLDNTII